jgi:hypothetical protein
MPTLILHFSREHHFYRFYSRARVGQLVPEWALDFGGGQGVPSGGREEGLPLREAQDNAILPLMGIYLRRLILILAREGEAA